MLVTQAVLQSLHPHELPDGPCMWWVLGKYCGQRLCVAERTLTCCRQHCCQQSSVKHSFTANNNKRTRVLGACLVKCCNIHTDCCGTHPHTLRARNGHTLPGTPARVTRAPSCRPAQTRRFSGSLCLPHPHHVTVFQPWGRWASKAFPLRHISQTLPPWDPTQNQTGRRLTDTRPHHRLPTLPLGRCCFLGAEACLAQTPEPGNRLCILTSCNSSKHSVRRGLRVRAY